MKLDLKKIQRKMKGSIANSIQTQKQNFFYNEDIDSAFELFSDMVMTKIQNYQAARSSWFIGSVIEQNINVSKYNFLRGWICINCQRNKEKAWFNLKIVMIANFLNGV